MLFNSFNYPLAKEGKNDNNTKALPVFKRLQKKKQSSDVMLTYVYSIQSICLKGRRTIRKNAFNDLESGAQ